MKNEKNELKRILNIMYVHEHSISFSPDNFCLKVLLGK